MHRPRRYINAIVAGAVVIIGMARPVLAEEMLAAIRLNEQFISEGEVIVIEGNGIEVSQNLLRRMRLMFPHKLSLNSTIPLDQLPGVKTTLDEQAMVVHVVAEPDAFEPTMVQHYVPARPADEADHPGLFINYNVLTQNTGDQNLSSGLFSLGSFSSYGVAMSDMVVSTQQGALRLRNYLTKDFASGDGSMVLGDSFFLPNAIGESFPFGGFQFSSRSYANADARQIPVETILGQAAVPSTIDVFVNNSLQSHQAVPAGPFVLQNVPLATGQGDIRVVVQDALGQQHLLVKSFYTNPNLLREGQREYAVEGGMLRRNYGQSSFDYIEPFLSGTYRYGWTNWLTTEIHAEGSSERQVVGEQTSFSVAPVIFRIGGAASNDHNMPGYRGIAGVETDLHPFSAGISTDLSTHNFTQLGYTDERLLQQSMQARLAYDFDAYGTLSASYTHLTLIGQPRNNTVAASYNVSLANIAFFGATAFSSLGAGGSTGVIASLSVPIGERALASAQVSHDQNGWGQSAQLVQSAPEEGGFGYRALVDNNLLTQRGEAGITYRSSYNEMHADVGTFNGMPIGRFGASGSVGLLGGEAFAARATDGNFAVVDTGVAGIHVLEDQQLIGVTDGDGKLVIPHLRAHQINHIAIDPSDIPFEDSAEEQEREIVPNNQTGYIIKFNLHRSLSATASMVLDDGTFVPAGSSVQNRRTGSLFIVGHDGMIYLTGLNGDDHFDVALANGACRIDVKLPNADMVQPNLGAITCHR